MATDSVTAKPRSSASTSCREPREPGLAEDLPNLSQEQTPFRISDYPEFLLANSEAYEWLLEKLRSTGARGNEEDFLHEIRHAATFATLFHPGRFADGTIENLAFEIGANLDRAGMPPAGRALPSLRKEGRRRVLHVAPSIAVGGHARLMYHWMQNDEASCHSVVLLNQQYALPSIWPAAVRRSGGNLVLLPPDAPLLQKARWLRELARKTADLVVWHLIWQDIVPTVAFATNACPPVMIFDHIDHLFWLGSSVADMLLNSRLGGSMVAERRFVPRNAVLPVPLVDSDGGTSRQAARDALGIDRNQIMLLSVGRAEKYRPRGPFDFVATANKLLDRNPDAHLYVVGESVAGIAPYLRCPIHERFHFVGPVDGASLYRVAADIYIESFPFGSLTALLEAGLSGLPVVPAYAPLAPTLVASDDALSDILANPGDEQEYLERADLLIRQPEQRLSFGQALRERLLADHVGQGWLTRLAAVYREADLLTHCPRPVPPSECRMTDMDIGLGFWHAMGDRPSGNRLSTPQEKAMAVEFHKAMVAKEAGHYARARRFAWRALRQAPLQRESWHLFFAAMLGRAAGKMRRALLRS